MKYLVLSISIIIFSCDSKSFKKRAAKEIRADLARAFKMYDCNNYSQVMKEYKTIEANHKNRWEIRCKNIQDPETKGKCARESKVSIDSNFESFRSKLYSKQDKCEAANQN